MYALFYLLGIVFIAAAIFVGAINMLGFGIAVPIAMTGFALLAAGEIINLLGRLLNNARMLVEDQRKSLDALTEMADLMKRQRAVIDQAQAKIANLSLTQPNTGIRPTVRLPPAWLGALCHQEQPPIPKRGSPPSKRASNAGGYGGVLG